MLKCLCLWSDHLEIKYMFCFNKLDLETKIQNYNCWVTLNILFCHFVYYYSHLDITHTSFFISCNAMASTFRAAEIFVITFSYNDLPQGSNKTIAKFRVRYINKECRIDQIKLYQAPANTPER